MRLSKNVPMDDPKVARVLKKYYTLWCLGGVELMPFVGIIEGDPHKMWKSRMERYRMDKTEMLCSCGVCQFIVEEADRETLLDR